MIALPLPTRLPPRSAIRTVIALLAAAIALLAPVRAAHPETTISLRAQARIADVQLPISLSDVADISGDDAAKWGEVVIADSAASRERVTIAEVRSALNRAGVNWGRMTLRGSVCVLDRPAAPAASTQVPARAQREGPRYAVIDVAGAPTIAKAVARRLAAHYSVRPADLQIAFDPADAAMLDAGVAEKHAVEVRPAASPTSSRVPVRATIYDGDRVVAEHRVTADVLVMRDVFVAARTIERRESIAEIDIRAERRWLAPGAARSASPPRESTLGAVARARIKEGDIVAQSDVESPVVVRRGEVVYVHCLSGSVAVQARARAMESGREGEVIAFRLEGADDSFAARIAGPGRAVMLAGPGATD
ncbi:MAG: flagellar basal body P-ring formation protein FlgA [Phycisphaeraceae bacterium]|nr:flagellar basal body P-ring formation protein FlgA [Phycisphaeraceae bacterium]